MTRKKMSRKLKSEKKSIIEPQLIEFEDKMKIFREIN